MYRGDHNDAKDSGECTHAEACQAADAFRSFMGDVDRAVGATVGLSVYDLPDFDFMEAFDAGESAADVAQQVLAEAGWDEGEEI